ncbi:uncharacterized protein B4U79_04406 [Dinothrombium tinctorium]|uniref:PDZ domain-containing protein n=1 Tax=Dinothrombium tinctorium TaxID=1965070 RepID=A0A3S4R272_9ACAR|nr:uncharacterized protein B4U79_08094 [Dinothrombium tinctorium]RWS10628.1 uncharacterized protein B4U79_04406 [Dinothrombium tinctorium]
MNYQNKMNSVFHCSDYAVPKMYKSKSCWTIDKNLQHVKPYNTESKLSESCTNVNKLCAIDPLESTDSMVCAFASVANVIKDDTLSECLEQTDDESSLKTNSYIIEVKPSVDQERNGGIEPENHLYETIYPSKPNSNLDLRIEINENTNEMQKNRLHNCDRKQEPLVTQLSHNQEPMTEKVTQKFYCDSNDQQTIKAEIKPILKDNKKEMSQSEQPDDRRKSDVPSFVSRCSIDTTRLQPDQIYPGYDTLRDLPSQTQPTQSSKVVYAVIAKNTKSPATCETHLSKSLDIIEKSNDSINTAFCDVKNMKTEESDVTRSVEDKREQKNAEKQESKHHTNRSFLRKLVGFKRAITRALSTEKIAKSSNVNNMKTNLETCQSVPVLTDYDIMRQSNENFQRMSLSNVQNIEPKSQSFVKSIATRMSLRRKPAKVKVKVDIEKVKNTNVKKTKMKQCLNPKEPKHDGIWGELKQLHSNGSQSIELHRSPGKPFGFFVARGTVNNVKGNTVSCICYIYDLKFSTFNEGVFVSRMRDEETQRSLTGLLEIGDEIIAIDGTNVKNSSIVQVNQLMAHKTKILLHVIPYVNHKYR